MGDRFRISVPTGVLESIDFWKPPFVFEECLISTIHNNGKSSNGI